MVFHDKNISFIQGNSAADFMAASGSRHMGVEIFDNMLRAILSEES